MNKLFIVNIDYYFIKFKIIYTFKKKLIYLNYE